MGVGNVMHTGISGMAASKAGIATTGHNISNATTEGFSRQRVEVSANILPKSGVGKSTVGSGVKVDRISRVNDEYLEKQIRQSGRDLSHMEEKDFALHQTEDIFNEMGGEGLNRLMSRFFNEFRKLANEPENQAVRESVREASVAMANDLHRLRKEVDGVRQHLDSKIEGAVSELNALAEELKDLNVKVRMGEVTGASPNDLLDQRDVVLKKMGQYVDLNMHKDNDGNFNVDIRGIGPLVSGPVVQKFSTDRTPADEMGKPENAVDVRSTATTSASVTHTLKGGKLGALIEVRDQTLSSIIDRLDDLAFNVSNAVNHVHRQGVGPAGKQGINFFSPILKKERAAELISLSKEVMESTNNIATAILPDSPGDNRVALAISGLQHMRLMSDGKATVDDFYGSIVGDVGVLTQRNRSAMNQQKDIQTQLEKMRERISGVSIDEETTNLMQFHQIYGASAKVIQVADECLKEVLDLRR